MPPAAGYVNAGGFMSDSKWYISSGQAGDVWLTTDEFVFDIGANGTAVTPIPSGGTSLNLALKWTTDKVSIRTARYARGGVAPLVSVRAGTLNINADPGASVHVRLLNLKGRTVANFRSRGNASHSLRRLPAGAYIVEAKRADGYRVRMPVALK